MKQTDEEHPGDLRALRRETAWCLAGALLGLTVLGVALMRLVSLDDGFLVKSALLYAAGAVLVFIGLPRHLPLRRFGAANQVTLARLALTGLVGGLVAEQGPGVAWAAVFAAGVVVSLDGVDGSLARRTGMSSPFGARFDMEVDALLILLLALIAWQLDKAGGWIILAGALRYGFVAAGYLWPWLLAPLPPSRRRKTACVLQIATLILCLVPWIRNPWSDMVAALGLAFLCYSFWVDVAWLVQRRHTEPQEDSS